MRDLSTFGENPYVDAHRGTASDSISEGGSAPRSLGTPGLGVSHAGEAADRLSLTLRAAAAETRHPSQSTAPPAVTGPPPRPPTKDSAPKKFNELFWEDGGWRGLCSAPQSQALAV